MIQVNLVQGFAAGFDLVILKTFPKGLFTSGNSSVIELPGGIYDVGTFYWLGSNSGSEFLINP